MGFERTPAQQEADEQKAAELGSKLSELVLENGDVLARAINFMGQNTRDSLRRAIEKSDEMAK